MKDSSTDVATQPFPPDFLWGAATSAFQIEGSPLADGAGESIWSLFCRQPGRILGGATGDLACDHFGRFRDDVRLMQDLGLQAYRFSIAWPRVLPEGRGPINRAGLDFYDRLVDALLAADIVPCVTLYHWDLPARLDAHGGWLNPDIADWFADYAEVMFRAFDDRVPLWTTLNEPWVTMHCGYLLGEHAPGRRDNAALPRVAHHQLRAHAAAVQRFRACRGRNGGGRIGLVVNMAPKHASSSQPDDKTAAQRADAYMNRWFLDAVFRGAYPDALPPMFGDAWPQFPADEMAALREPVDFIGINYYSRDVVRHAPDVGPSGAASVGVADAAFTDIGWEVYPDGLRETLVRVTRDYGPIPLYVMENGAAYHAPAAVGEMREVPDQRRVDYLREHIASARNAIEEGVDLRGYFVWSLLDNFEWAYGYSQRFGIVHVDYASQRRTPKRSAHYYRDVIRSRGTILDGY